MTLQVRGDLLLAVWPMQDHSNRRAAQGREALAAAVTLGSRLTVVEKAGAVEGTEAFREGDRHNLICKYVEIPTATAGKNPPRCSHGNGRYGFPPEAGTRAVGILPWDEQPSPCLLKVQ